MTRIALNSPISNSEIRVPDVQAPRAYTAKDAAVLNWRFGNLTAERLLWVAARHLFPGRLAVVTSFGADSAVVLDMVSRIARHLPVIFLETGKHFPETLEYRDKLATELGLTDVRSVTPLAEDIAREDGAFDRFVSTYVLDLLSDEDIDALLREAHRVLAPGGRLCLASLTFGVGPVSRLVTGTWQRLHRWRGSLTGGCRPIRLTDHIDPALWEVRHQNVVVQVGVPSQVVVATPQPSR